MRQLFAALSLLALCNCSWIGRQADALGEHMPVIGERCEHWQCMSSSGQAISEANKKSAESKDTPANMHNESAPQMPTSTPTPSATPTPTTR